MSSTQPAEKSAPPVDAVARALTEDIARKEKVGAPVCVGFGVTRSDAVFDDGLKLTITGIIADKSAHAFFFTNSQCLDNIRKFDAISSVHG